MKDIRYIIADNVRLYRKRENLTQAELAERSELLLEGRSDKQRRYLLQHMLQEMAKGMDELSNI